MHFWAYNRGEWKEMPNPFGEEETFEENLADLHFDPQPILQSGTHGFVVKVYALEEEFAAVDVNGFHETAVEGEFFVLLEVSTRSHVVLVADLPSLVRLLGELGPVLAGGRKEAT